MSSSGHNPRFSQPQVEDYEKRRYRGLDQRLVDWKERRAVRRCLLRILGRNPAEGTAPSEDAVAGKKCGNLPAGPVILDAPCGYGRLLEIAREAVGWRGLVLCADVSEAMVARAMARAATGESGWPSASWRMTDSDPATVSGAAGKACLPEKAGDNHPPAAGFAADIVAGIPLRDGAADVVLSMRLFHHLHRTEDRCAALAEFARVARLGAVVSFYRGNRLHALQRRIRARLKGKRYEIRMLAGKMFEAEAAAAGFRVAGASPLFRGIHAQCIVVLIKRAAPEPPK